MALSPKDHDTLATLYDIIHEVEVASLTTVRSDGTLHTRPMATRFREPRGDLWFFTRDHAAKAEEIRQDHEVALGYTDPRRNLYACISGTATVVRDRPLQKKLWAPQLRLWFPKGCADPELALLRVRIRSAEYWNAPPSGAMEIVAAVQMELGEGQAATSDDHGRVEVEDQDR